MSRSAARPPRRRDLEPVRAPVARWRHFACTELTSLGSYFQVLATGRPPAGSIWGEEMKELIADLASRSNAR
jgi:hypothetical protein